MLCDTTHFSESILIKQTLAHGLVLEFDSFDSLLNDSYESN